MGDLKQLLDIEDIKRVKAQYCRFVDMRDWEGLKNLFSEGCVFDGTDAGMPPINNRDEFVAVCRGGLDDENCISVHHVHIPEIDFLCDTKAIAIWPMEDMLHWKPGGASSLISMHGFGHYFETYEKTDGRWKITDWKITRLRVDTVPAQT